MKIDTASLTSELAFERSPYSGKSTSELRSKRAQAVKEIEVCMDIDTMDAQIYAHIWVEILAHIDTGLIVRN
jgi:hypothetical protein